MYIYICLSTFHQVYSHPTVEIALPCVFIILTTCKHGECQTTHPNFCISAPTHLAGLGFPVIVWLTSESNKTAAPHLATQTRCECVPCMLKATQHDPHPPSPTQKYISAHKCICSTYAVALDDDYTTKQSNRTFKTEEAAYQEPLYWWHG